MVLEIPAMFSHCFAARPAPLLCDNDGSLNLQASPAILFSWFNKIWKLFIKLSHLGKAIGDCSFPELHVPLQLEGPEGSLQVWIVSLDQIPSLKSGYICSQKKWFYWFGKTLTNVSCQKLLLGTIKILHNQNIKIIKNNTRTEQIWSQNKMNSSL